jgi:hypothetical protein
MRTQAIILATVSICLVCCGRSGDSSNPKDSLGVRTESAIPVDSPYQLNAEQKVAVERLLSDSATWRLAIDSDNSRPTLREIQRERPEYHPYYMGSDINMDGRPDFAIGLARDSMIALFWFAKRDSGYSRAHFVAQADWFAECGFALDPQPGQFYFGHFYSDVGVFMNWDSTKQDLEAVPETDEDSSSD